MTSIMLSVDDAITSILDGADPLDAESIPITECVGRIASQDICARITQPPFSASAMDGYAVRFENMAVGAKLNVIGEAPAGAPFAGNVGDGDAVRIFTGGVVPPGADHVLIQEDVTREGDQITVNEPQATPRNIRSAGVDFKEGDVLVRAGETLHEIHGSLLAAANIGEISVRRRPKVALFSNGDELVEPGATLKPGQIINSNHYALKAMIECWGGDADYLGCASDSEEALKDYFARAQSADIIVPIGGASVGDYDYVKTAFHTVGGETVFEKVAVRPGKPAWFGRLKKARIIGLPGNPASAIVTASLFLQPLTRRLGGQDVAGAPVFQKAILSAPLKANGGRESYLRGTAVVTSGGVSVEPANNQDSSLLTPFATANVLIRRTIGAQAAHIGDEVEIVQLR